MIHRMDERQARAALAALISAPRCVDDVLRAVQRGLLDGTDLIAIQDAASELGELIVNLKIEARMMHQTSGQLWFSSCSGKRVHLANAVRVAGKLRLHASCNSLCHLDVARPETEDGGLRCFQCSRIAAACHIRSGGETPTIVALHDAAGDTVGWATQWLYESCRRAWLFVSTRKPRLIAHHGIQLREAAHERGDMSVEEWTRQRVLTEEVARAIRRREIEVSTM